GGVDRGGPFTVTSPARAGATRVCTIVNRALKPVLAISKTATKRVVASEGTVGVVIRLTNRGRGAARNVEVCDRLPDGLVFVRAPGARFVNGNACWRIDHLPAAAAKSFSVRTRAVRTSRRVVLVNVV